MKQRKYATAEEAELARQEYQRNYYLLHREKAKEYQRQYQILHPKKKKGKKKKFSEEKWPKLDYNPHDIISSHGSKLVKKLNQIIWGEKGFVPNHPEATLDVVFDYD